MTRVRIMIALILLILTGIGVYYHFRTINPIAIGDSIGAYYRDPHPLVTFYPTRTDNSYEPMYLIKLQGNFTTGSFRTSTINFSILANGTYLWSETTRHGNHVVYNFPGVPMYQGDFVFTPLFQSVNWGD